MSVVDKNENRIQFVIIVVAYNAGDKLRYTLDSIYGQQYHNYHVIIKDGLSTDGSLTQLKEEKYFDNKPGKTDIFSDKDKGIYDAMNIAIEKMRSLNSMESVKNDKYVIFMNCGDSFFDKQTLGYVADFIEEELTDKKEESRGPFIFYGNQYNRSTNTIVSSSPSLNEFSLYRNVPCHQVCFYDEALFEERGYNTEYVVRADYEHFLYSVYEKKAQTIYMNTVTSAYEGGGFSETRDNRKKSEEEHIVITDYYMGKRAKKYRRIMFLSGAGLRTRLAEGKYSSGVYNAIKSFIYGKRK